MGLILQVLGAVFLLILAYVAFRVLVLVGKVGLILFAVKKLVSHVEASASAATIRLTPVVGASWDDPTALDLAAPLPGLGYRQVGFFDRDVLGESRLQAWVHPELGLYCVIGHDAPADTWADVVTRYQDGTSLTYSNSGHGDRHRQRPGSETVDVPGLGTAELHRKMIVERPDRPTRLLATTDFVADYEQAHAEEMAWRASPEGFDPQAMHPLEAMVGMMKQKFTPDQKQQIRESFVLRVYEMVAGPLRRAYRDQTPFPDEVWGELQPRLVFVWDTMNVDSLRTLLTEWQGLPDWDQLEPGPTEDPETAPPLRRRFADMNAGLPIELRLTRLGQLRLEELGGSPLEADVYERLRPAVGRALPGPSITE